MVNRFFFLNSANFKEKKLKYSEHFKTSPDYINTQMWMMRTPSNTTILSYTPILSNTSVLLVGQNKPILSVMFFLAIT